MPSSLLPLAFGGVLALHSCGAIRTVFRTVRTGKKPFPTFCALLGGEVGKEGGFQLLVHWKYRGTKPLADQRIGNALGADTFLTIVQGNTKAIVVVAAFVHQPTHLSVLLVVHYRNGFTVFQGLLPPCNRVLCSNAAIYGWQLGRCDEQWKYQCPLPRQSPDISFPPQSGLSDNEAAWE